MGLDGARVRGGGARPAWERPAVVGVLALTAFAYLWNLGASGWANAFYSAAVQAGSVSWKAFFFGSFDAANFITVDKPPAFLWVMDLSARLFGLNPWSVLVPQALEGVACVALLYAAVRRWAGPAAALTAAVALALTPVAALMFRYNNPDALLTLLVTAACYAEVRALEGARTRWLMLAAALVGTAFLVKMLEAYLVVPALVLTYLLFAPAPVGRRLGQLALAAGTVVLFSGWWVAVVQLLPPSARPYIGSSQDNSLLNLIFGYNGFGRLTGHEAGSVGGGPPGATWGLAGWDRLFHADMAGQISWLVPAAVVLAVAALWTLRPEGGEEVRRLRAALSLWLSFFLTAAVVFSFARGIIHPYYTVLLAPPVGALVGIGGEILWRRREERAAARGALAVACVLTALWAFALLDLTPGWLPWLRWAIGGVGMSAGLLLAAPRLLRPVAVATGAAALAAGLAGPAAYAMDTVATPHAGAIPAAGPSPVGRAGFGAVRAGGGGLRPGFAFGQRPPRRFPPGGAGFAFGRFGGFGPPPAGGSVGGLLNASRPPDAVVRLLSQDASHYTWVAATVGANPAAGYQLALRRPVMAIGGFNGTDPAPTLAQFRRYVREGRIHYFIVGGLGFGPSSPAVRATLLERLPPALRRRLSFFPPRFELGARRAPTDASQITNWVESHFPSLTVDGVRLYRLG
ncbi:MAG: glycosyltransferase family 39 protein [Firmicutes bacterium]|nr:glycosyltransferase family 39 protein [Bacillota bacterium]